MTNIIVAGDVAVHNTDLSFADFQALVAVDQPLGYGPWQDFEAGDYEFLSALIEVTLGRQAANIDLQLTNMGVTSDLPDISDGGTVNVSASGTAVTFVRTFHDLTKLRLGLALLAGGSAVRCAYSNLTLTGFTLHCYDSSGAAVTGTVGWIAQGV